MPTAEADGTTLRYELSGHEDGPVVAFVPDVGFGPWVWGWQAPSLSGAYRTLVYAPRGTDGSGSDGPYTIDRFAADLETVLSAAAVRRVHLVGAGLGAAVSLRYANRYGRARSLSLFAAVASGERMDEKALSILCPSDRTRLRSSLSAAFSDRFLAESGLVKRIVEWRSAEDAEGDALSGHRAAAVGFDAGPLYEVSVPALVCHGTDDPVVPIEAAEELAKELPYGRFEAVSGKRCFYVEHAAAVTDRVDEFLDGVASDGRSV